MSDTYQTLLETRCEHPLPDDEAAELIDRLSERGVLSEREAQALVWSHGQELSRQTIADRLAMSPEGVDNARRRARQRLEALDETLAAISDLRDAVRPDPTRDAS